MAIGLPPYRIFITVLTSDEDFSEYAINARVVRY